MTDKIDFDKIKKGALRRQLKVPDNYTFTRAALTRINATDVGQKFKFKGNEFRMTPLLKKRITFAISLIKIQKNRK
jgi:hypothetical protein